VLDLGKRSHRCGFSTMIEVDTASRPGPYPQPKHAHILTLKLLSGKTAPRLIEDIVAFDPGRSRRDILADVPKQKPALPERNTSPGNCRHNFMNKPDQSIIPPLDSRPEPGAVYKVASFCADCRCHLLLKVEYRGKVTEEIPCPSHEFPLHHFRCVSHKPRHRQVSAENLLGEPWMEERILECSSLVCSAVLTVVLSPPRLTPEFVTLLTDREVIAERVRRAEADGPDREWENSEDQLGPFQVLSWLRQYITDAMHNMQRKRISVRNKKFACALGDDCRELLEFLGFTIDVSVSVS
jgi:ubiquitin carboxyl-terminal hydrolase 25